ncbi:HET-domain-containing protein, partial [Podospora aff. communis PSN243]
SKSPLTTTRATLEKHKRQLPAQRLPKTFQDAIELARKLRIRYIWIDSLCIVQDDAGDWASESKQMGMIYERRYLTIAATSS